MDTKNQLDMILKAFESYIKTQNYFDIVYSEKIGYLRILVEAPDECVIVLDTPEIMLEYLCSDVINDVVYAHDNPNQFKNDLMLSEYEEAESRRRLIAIIQKIEGAGNCLAIVDKQIKKYKGIPVD